MSRQSLLADVRAELAGKSKQQIEAETADRWCARAIVAYENYAEAMRLARTTKKLADARKAERWLTQAVEYEHEAVEHAGEAGTVDAVRAAVREARRRAGVAAENGPDRGIRSIFSVRSRPR